MAKKFVFLLRVADYLHNGKPTAAVAGAQRVGHRYTGLPFTDQLQIANLALFLQHVF